MACLKIASGGKQAVWDSRTGRYASLTFLTGNAPDPASGGRMPDSELMLAGAAAQLPLRNNADN